MSESASHSPKPEDVAQAISNSSRSRFVWIVVVAILAAAGVGAYLLSSSNGIEVQYKTVEVDRGSLVATATARVLWRRAER